MIYQRMDCRSCSKSVDVDLAQAKERLKAIEDGLADAQFLEIHAFEREGRTLRRVGQQIPAGTHVAQDRTCRWVGVASTCCCR